MRSSTASPGASAEAPGASFGEEAPPASRASPSGAGCGRAPANSSPVSSAEALDFSPGGKRSPFLMTRVAIPLLQSLAPPPGDALHTPGGCDHIKGARGPHQHPPHMHPDRLERRWTHGPHQIPGPKPPDPAALLRLAPDEAALIHLTH